MDSFNEPINLNTYANPDQPEPINLSSGVSPMSDYAATNLAVKASFGLADKVNKDYESFKEDFKNGQEDKLRRESAAQVDFQKANQQQQLISNMVKMQGSPLTPDQAKFARGTFELSKITGSTVTDPSSVFEEYYGGAYMKTLAQVAKDTYPESPVNKANEEVPDLAASDLKRNGELITYRSYAEKKAYEMSDAAQNQSYLGWGVDLAKGLVNPLYSEMKLRGLAEDNPTLKGLFGTNISETVRSAYLLPFPKFKEWLDTTLDKLKNDNPSLAAEFAHHVINMSTDDVIGQNFMTPINVATVGTMLGGVARSAKNLTGVFSNIAANRRAIRNMIESTERPEVAQERMLADAWEKSVNFEAAGATGEAGAWIAAANMTENLRVNPNKFRQALDSVMSGFRTDRAGIQKNTGRGGQAVANKLEDSYGILENRVEEAITAITRVERTSGLNMAANFLSDLKEQVKGLFPGIKNAITDITAPYKEQLSNTKYYDVHVGQLGGDLFGTPEEAKAFAELHQLPTYKVEQQGAGHRIVITRPLDETLPLVRNALIRTKLDKTPTSWLSMLNWGRTPDDVLSHAQSLERKTSMYGANILINLAKEQNLVINRLASRLRSKGPTEPSIGPIGFRTESGSTYLIHGDRTTTRLKAPREEPPILGDSGPKPRSNRTVYVTPEDADRLGPPTPSLGWRSPGAPPGRASRFVDNGDGTISRHENVIGEGFKEVEDKGNIPYREAPEVGTVPLQLYKPVTIGNNSKGYVFSHFGNKVSEVHNPEAGPSTRFSSQRFEDWKRVIEHSRDMIDPETKQKGYFFNTIGELEDHYLRFIHRLPNEMETQAYFAFKNLTELDRVLRNLAVFRNKSRLGAESHAFSMVDGEGNTVTSPRFDGRHIKDFPGGDENILIATGEVGKEKIFNPSGKRVNPKDLAEYRKGLLEGRYKLIEVLNPERRPFEGFGDKIGNARVKYVLSDKMDTEPLSWNQVPRRGGPHFEYDYDHYIKQARMRFDKYSQKWWYEGDTTVMPMMSRQQGRDVAAKLDTIRVLLREKRVVEARTYASQNLPMNWNTISGWFKESHGPNGKIPPLLSYDEPVQLVAKNKMIGDVDNNLHGRYVTKDKLGRELDRFKDGTRRNQYGNVDYTGERDAYEVFTLNDKGTRHNPAYEYEPAQFVDPVSTMNRSLSKIIQSTFLDDYKIFSVEHWLQEAKNYLDASPSEIAAAPNHYFHHGKWLSGADKEVTTSLDIAKYQINNLLGTPSKLDNFLQSTAQTLSDASYRAFGPNKLLDPWWMLPKVVDAARYTRGAVFHTVIGLFSPAQFLVQSMTYASIFGIAGPTKGIQGSTGALLHQFSRFNQTPAVLDRFDSFAVKLGWRPGEWKEAMREMERTGFGNIGTEHVLRDATPKLFQSEGANFLDAGLFFWREGERNTRYGAWYTAYKEFRDKKPTGRITDQDRKEILERADLLSGNMTDASKSMLQRGALSFPTQFLAYQIRLTDLMLSQRISPAAKIRLFGTYAALFGIPTAAGIGAFPFGDSIRKAALENGYNVGENFITSLAGEGGIATAMAYMTGGGDRQKGNWYNVGDRYGNPGFDLIRDVLRGDKSFWKIATGATGSKLADAFALADPYVASIQAAIRNDGTPFHLGPEQALDVVKQLQTGNQLLKLTSALKYGQWFSKNEGLLANNISKPNAFFMAFTGLQPVDTSDVNRLSMISKDREEADKEIEKNFKQEFRRALYYSRNGQDEAYKTSMENAFAYLTIGGYPEEKRERLYASVSDINKTLIESLEFSIFVRNVPPDRREEFLDTYRRRVQSRNKQQGIEE